MNSVTTMSGTTFSRRWACCQAVFDKGGCGQSA
jgi:hypothetical protein